ncbi:MAG TPA: glycosyltransferase [Mucilaginibacter sp.]|jgi:hypothetical protein|nr:glycosyltransferase [Mucilaginibacter sp.]
MSLAPIVLFVYNRPRHTEQTLNALAENYLADQSTLFIYADGPKNDASAEALKEIKETREVIRQKKWCKEIFIIESSTNKGLANSVIAGVTEIVNRYEKIIVLEDDLVCHRSFLTYMNRYLDIYSVCESVISIHGFMYPTNKKINSPFFIKGADCWGWATWKRGWDLFEPDGQKLMDNLVQKGLTREFNFNDSYHFSGLLQSQIEGKIDSWAIRWYAAAFLQNKLTLYPPLSLIQNIGFDGSGTHKDNNIKLTPIRFHFEDFEYKEIDIVESKRNKKLIEDHFRGDKNLFKSIKSKLKSFLLFQKQTQI